MLTPGISPFETQSLEWASPEQENAVGRGGLEPLLQVVTAGCGCWGWGRVGWAGHMSLGIQREVFT